MKKPMDYDFWYEEAARIVTFKDVGDKTTIDAKTIYELTGMFNCDIPLEEALKIMERCSKGLSEAVRDFIDKAKADLSDI